MMSAYTISPSYEDRYLLVDDTDEDTSQILTVICDGNPRHGRGIDFDAYAMRGAE
jgi:hypothetical protein